MRTRSSFNRLNNAKNSFQGRDRKVLCVCSAGLLRSPTLAEILVKEYGYNTRACGSSQEYALIPIDDALIYWADEVVFVNQENYDEAALLYKDALRNTKVTILDVTDSFPFRDPELQNALKTAYAKAGKSAQD